MLLSLMLTVFAIVQEPAAPQPSATAVSQCGVSDDAEYAYKPSKPVQVGGGPMYLAARERRYLDALRGPAGGPVTYKRAGTIRFGKDGLTILDRYELTYAGLERPIDIFMDGYHFDDDLKAPKGLTCGARIALNDPGPDGFKTSESLIAVAIERGAADLAPIPLDPDGSGTAGVAFDRYRILARLARAAAAKGTPLSPRLADRPRLPNVGTVVIAHARVCDGKPIEPRTIELAATFANGQRSVVERQGDLASGEALAALVPGYQAPPSSIGASFPLESLRPNESITITYAEACGGSNTVTMPVRFTTAKLVSFPSPPLPPDVSPASGYVRLQVLIDPSSGAFRDPIYVGGNEALVEAAATAVRETWTVEPARINGAPIAWGVTLLVRFGGK